MSFDGFLNGDTEADITLPNASTPATSESDPGEYPSNSPMAMR
ncbi:MAG: hypothetical protein HRT61_13275 [Ekhidna sp.]|nr:hypothetical protein [Ekhidna sp.]